MNSWEKTFLILTIIWCFVAPITPKTEFISEETLVLFIGMAIFIIGTPWKKK